MRIKIEGFGGVVQEIDVPDEPTIVPESSAFADEKPPAPEAGKES